MYFERFLGAIFLCTAFVLSASAWGGTIDEAKQLTEEAQKILRSASGTAADPKVYADAMRKLQKADALLEEVAKSNPKEVEALQEEVSAALFWARRFSNVNVINELQKGSGESIAVPATPVAAPKTTTGDPAKEAFQKAEAFEQAHAGDDHAIALRWFQMADQFTGTDWSLRGLGRAQEAQARYQATEAAKMNTAAPATEDAKLILAGNLLFNQKNFEGALAKFQEAKKVAASTLVDRRIAHTYLEMGYKCRDQYAAQYLPVLQRYNEARRRGDAGQAAALARQAQDLVNRLRPLENEAIKDYESARQAFQSGLDLAKGQDLDCEAGIAILYFERKDRVRARQLLGSVLEKYRPANDEERTVYEYCRSILKRI